MASRMIVKIPKKYKAAIEEQWIKMKNADYASVLGTKNALCEDHFVAPSGCQGTCPFARFTREDAGTGCMAWMKDLVESFDISLQPPQDWSLIFPVLSGEISSHIEWV